MAAIKKEGGCWSGYWFSVFLLGWRSKKLMYIVYTNINTFFFCFIKDAIQKVVVLFTLVMFYLS